MENTELILCIKYVHFCCQSRLKKIWRMPSNFFFLPPSFSTLPPHILLLQSFFSVRLLCLSTYPQNQIMPAQSDIHTGWRVSPYPGFVITRISFKYGINNDIHLPSSYQYTIHQCSPPQPQYLKYSTMLTNCMIDEWVSWISSNLGSCLISSANLCHLRPVISSQM